MIRGIGIDIVEIARIERACRRWEEKFRERLYTDAEWAYCTSRAQPYAAMAARFAAKEAVMKALGVGVGKIGWREIEISREEYGRPRVRLYGKARDLARRQGITEIWISLSHCRDYASACAVAEGGSGR
ncbi:holo-ACP synthase [Calderihabitans maritimus]|uniref:Holo-[acyl-carrier-protein] synthase n=1 Tax=Calderihabitans maritimus TaxID=1246530 RepID=A0A1Z5HT66_9FIRM|nr:holo-ACP synthase [Calderihabitans maritimus]GAW92521.1 phosphopantetheinyl transferase [Calderihabitans maritimus]